MAQVRLQLPELRQLLPALGGGDGVARNDLRVYSSCVAHEALGNPRRYEEVLPLLRAHLES